MGGIGSREPGIGGVREAEDGRRHLAVPTARAWRPSRPGGLGQDERDEQDGSDGTAVLSLVAFILLILSILSDERSGAVAVYARGRRSAAGW